MLRQNFNKKWTVRDLTSALEAFNTNEVIQNTYIDLPHDAMIYTKRAPASAGGRGIGFFAPQDVVYTKTFFVPESDKGKAIFLEFEGVYMKSIVRVNGEYAGQCAYGYNDFFVQINDLLHYGADNIVEVTALNTQQANSRWYSGTGIYRNVKYIVGEPLHIVPDGVRVTTEEEDVNLAVLRVEADIENSRLTAGECRLGCIIKDGEGKAVYSGTVKFAIRAGERMTVEQRIYLKTPKLWNTDEPNMYTCCICIMESDEEVDADEIRFGIRKLSLDPQNGLRINGKSIKLKGGCIHHDNGVLGAATFEAAEERRVRLMKEAGYNAIRSAHNPISKALLDACDKYGVLVMDEYCDVWLEAKSTHDYSFDVAANWATDLERMVCRDYNHPCVILYSIGNEIHDNGKKYSPGFGRKLVSKIKELDRSRYVTDCINPMFTIMDRMGEVMESLTDGIDENTEGKELNEIMSDMGSQLSAINSHPIVDSTIEEACDMLDVVGYNYAAARYQKDHEKNPNRIFIGSETSSADLATNWEKVTSFPYVLGDFNWTAWDYLGESGIGRIGYSDAPAGLYGDYPWRTAWCGDFDITGFRRSVSYWREIVWGGRDHTPHIAVQRPEKYGKNQKSGIWGFTDAIRSWTWPKFENREIVIEVYSDAEEVELEVNGVSLGRKPVGNEFKAFYCCWDTVYSPGKVVAIAYIDGKEVGRDLIQTAGVPNLRATKESDSLKADSNDLCFITVELVDDQGIVNMSDDRIVELSIEGPATIQGAGSADPQSEENFSDMQLKTFEGRLLVVVRSTEESGTAKLTVTSKGLESVVVDVNIT